MPVDGLSQLKSEKYVAPSEKKEAPLAPPMPPAPKKEEIDTKKFY